VSVMYIFVLMLSIAGAENALLEMNIIEPGFLVMMLRHMYIRTKCEDSTCSMQISKMIVHTSVHMCVFVCLTPVRVF
jgi:hypothetical protein